MKMPLSNSAGGLFLNTTIRSDYRLLFCGECVLVDKKVDSVDINKTSVDNG
jgi:hypothetical protein